MPPKKKPAPKTPELKKNQEKWSADFGDLTASEFDRVLEITGLSFNDFKKRPGSLLAGTAVVIRQRTEPVPDETWKTLKFSDLDVKGSLAGGDFENVEDPT